MLYNDTLNDPYVICYLVGSHLFLDILVLRVQQLNENGNSTCFNHYLGMQEGSWGDVG